MLSYLEELLFWTAIMHDHADFQIAALSSREPDAIRLAQCYKNAFTSLHNEVCALMNTMTGTAPEALQAGEAAGLIARTEACLLGFINFKRLLLRRLLECSIELNFTPSFLNHMINEAMEFHRILCLIKTGMPAGGVREIVHLHKIWLPDASGHAAAVACDLDPVEKLLVKEAEKFKKIFDGLFIKASELGLMLERTCLEDGSLEWLNEEVRKHLCEFICFLRKIQELRCRCKALGAIKPAVPDHMAREEEYYLANIQR